MKNYSRFSALPSGEVIKNMSAAEELSLTAKGMENALKLFEGRTPSELGYSFLKAAIALTLLEAHLLAALGQIKDALERVRHLKETYAEAARLVEPEK